MSSLADFEKLRVGLIQKIATADTPEKISALLAQINSPSDSAQNSGNTNVEEVNDVDVEEEDKVIQKTPEEVIAARQFLKGLGPQGMCKFQTSLVSKSSRTTSEDDNANSDGLRGQDISRTDFLSISTDVPSNMLLNLADFLFEEGEKSDRLIVRDVLFKIVGNFNSARQNMSTATFLSFDRLDKRKDKGSASLASILSKFSPYNHPLVKSGMKNVNTVAQEFFHTFHNNPKSDGCVTEDEWELYVVNQSFFIDKDSDFELFLRRTWKLSGTFHLDTAPSSYESTNTSSPGRSTGRKLMTDKHGEIYGSTFSISADKDNCSTTPLPRGGKKTFSNELKNRHVGSHMKGAAAMSIDDVSPSGRKVHVSHNVSQLDGMTPTEGSEMLRASRKQISVNKDTLSGSGVDPGELNYKMGLKKFSAKDHFLGNAIGVASNEEGEVKNRGLKRLPVGSDTHFKDGHVAEDDIEPPRGLKRISVSSNMDNSGLSKAEAVVVRKRQNKSLESNKPYYWDDKNDSAAKAKDNDFSESISGRRKGGIKKITPGGNSQIIFG